MRSSLTAALLCLPLLGGCDSQPSESNGQKIIRLCHAKFEDAPTYSACLQGAIIGIEVRIGDHE